jgi:hypothetical protein
VDDGRDNGRGAAAMDVDTGPQAPVQADERSPAFCFVCVRMCVCVYVCVCASACVCVCV